MEGGKSMTSTDKTGTLRALVLRAPGINCERETAHACRLVGFETELVHINTLLQAPERLLDYSFLVLPGGFSYGDDLGAGTLLAKNLTMHLGAQLRQFIQEGRPVLGICNGFQVLVRAGLLPGEAKEADVGTTSARPLFREMAKEPNVGTASARPGSRGGDTSAPIAGASLTDNASAQFECRWVTLAPLPSTCIFTRGIARLIELPVAHGEGQFVLQGDISELQANGQLPLLYTTPQEQASGTVSYPANPNGSVGNIAGVCNVRGNVFGLMPHPERFVSTLQHPQRRSSASGHGDGLLIFQNAYTYAHELTYGAAPAEALSTAASATNAYTASGVDIAAAERAKRMMHSVVRATQGSEVLAGMGAFAGVFSLQRLHKMRQPALVASTDGVGTKTLLAVQAQHFDTIGYDLVNHCVNDLLTQGAEPLFFLDYLAMGKLEPQQAARIVRGVAHACKQVGCALLGGETAEMPDVYLPGAFDLAGTIVGVVEQDEVITGKTIRAGDVLLGLPSSGLHTNGYSLARRVFAPYPLDAVFPELGEPLIDALLRPHRCYLNEVRLVRDYLAYRGRFIKGIAHITGGGFAGNISRILPQGMQAIVETQSWTPPPLFQLLARLGRVSHEEQYRALNMGIGMVLVLSPKGAIEARSVLPELITIGSITEGEGVVVR
jgi:phosphoribosylformylglycinamidine synthase I